MSNRAIANTLQIFEGNLAMRVFSLRHKSFCDYVINRTSESGFPTRQSVKMSFSRFSTATLKGCLEVVDFLSNFIDFLAGIKLAIAIDSQMDNTEVYSECASGIQE